MPATEGPPTTADRSLLLCLRAWGDGAGDARLRSRIAPDWAGRLPIGPRTIAVLSHSGFMLPVRDPGLAAVGVKEFLTTPLDWYFHLALSTSRHARVSLSSIAVPAVFVAARYDVLAGARDMATAAARMDDAEYVELRGSHFLPMEKPEVVHRLLLEFLDRLG